MNSPHAPRLRVVRESDRPDAAAIDDLFRRRARFVSGIAYRMLGRDDEIDDVIQEVFVGLLRYGDCLRWDDAEGNIDGLLATMTVRAVGHRLRWRRLRRLVGLDADVDYGAVVAPDADPEARLTLARVYRALDDLPAAQRLAWSLRYIEGEALGVVAQRCRCSLATAKRRIATAHHRLARKVGTLE